MNLKKAIGLIEGAVGNMRLYSGRPVFNEWMIVDTSDGEVALLTYFGPRSTASQKRLRADLRSLEEEMQRGGFTHGQFFFNQEAEGTLYDAFIVAGQNKYIIFNNTLMSMKEIGADPFWSKTQIHFVELSERFHGDALA